MSDEELKHLPKWRRYWRKKALKEEDRGGLWLYAAAWSWMLEAQYGDQIRALKKKARTQ